MNKNLKNDSLSDRMKRYEFVTTGTNLLERLPIYARIDMRAGHSWCRNLNKPFDDDYSNAMQSATAYIVEKTGAIVGYTQSDEASFVWEDSTKIPFETRLFKLQSVLASMFTSAFIKACLKTKLEDKLEKSLPSFDCRVLNLPSMSEAANMILWREKDSIKNSITLLALEHFSNNDIYKKNSTEKIDMLKTLKNVCYEEVLTESQRNGAYFRREVFQHELSNDELQKIPENHWPPADENGNRAVTRSRVVEFSFGMPISQIENRVAALFYHEKPIARQK